MLPSSHSTQERVVKTLIWHTHLFCNDLNVRGGRPGEARSCAWGTTPSTLQTKGWMSIFSRKALTTLENDLELLLQVSLALQSKYEKLFQGLSCVLGGHADTPISQSLSVYQSHLQ